MVETGAAEISTAEISGATWDDLDGVYELLDVRSRATTGISELKFEHLRDRWKLPAFAVGRDNWVARADGRIVGYAAVSAAQELEHAAKDAAVGDALLARAAERARERGFGTITVTAAPEDAPLLSLVGRSGFDHDREILRMWRPLNADLPEPRWPDGVKVGAYDAAEAVRVHAFLDDAYAGWDTEYVVLPHDEWVAFMTDHDDFDPALWFLAERGGDLVGCALHWKPLQSDGWVKDLVVRVDERGAGLGKALLHQGFRAYAERGAARVGLKVDANNPTGARQLYERVGFVTDRRYEIWLKRL
jgi:ribosomal protein S18 acetylase RimI-like enzyme